MGHLRPLQHLQPTPLTPFPGTPKKLFPLHAATLWGQLHGIVFLEPLHGIFFVWAFHYHIPLAQVMSGTCGPVCCGKNWAPIDGSQLFCEHFIPSHCKPVSCNFMMPCEILGRQLWRNLSETSPVQIHGTQVMEEHLSLPPPSPKTHPNLFPVPLAGPKYGAKPKGQAMPPSGRKLQGPSCGSSRHSCQGGGI